MSYLAQKIEAEKRMRDLLEASDLPQPDRVEYGFNCVRLFFEAARRVVVIDLEAPGEGPPEMSEPSSRRDEVSDFDD